MLCGLGGCGGLPVVADDFLRDLLDEAFFHQSADFEFDGPFGWHLYPLKGFGVLSDASGSELALEHAEVAKLQTVALAEFLDDFVEESLDDALDHDTLTIGALRNAVNQLFFGNGFRTTCHDSPV